MTLNELLGIDEALNVLADFPYLLIEIDEELLNAGVGRLDESSWRQSAVKGLMYRVDPADPKLSQKRHVHVAAEKHVRTKAKQASWNDDGSRHDRHSFNDKLGKQASYQDVARAVLKLPAGTILEHVVPQRARVGLKLFESITGSDGRDEGPLKMRVMMVESCDEREGAAETETETAISGAAQRA